MTTPVDRRFVADAEAHRRDAPRFCPACGAGLAIATEFWEAEDRRFYCSCTGCGWTGEITPTGAVAMGHEPDHYAERAWATTSCARVRTPRSSLR
jgi:hypothetical protein